MNDLVLKAKSVPANLYDHIPSLLCIECPIRQFYMIYEPGGTLFLDSKKFTSKQEIVYHYVNTENFYRWVYVESINDNNWNLIEIMPIKNYVEKIV